MEEVVETQVSAMGTICTRLKGHHEKIVINKDKTSQPQGTIYNILSIVVD